MLFRSGTGKDNGQTLVSDDLKLKVTDGGHITKYKVVKESDLDKNTGETTGNTSAFSVFYKNYDSSFWGVSDLPAVDKIGVGDSATFKLSVKSGAKAGTYSETYIVVTDRSEYAIFSKNADFMLPLSLVVPKESVRCRRCRSTSIMY